MYTPLNAAVYQAAYSGAFGSMSASMRTVTSPNPADYSSSARAAGAWAQAFDTAWAGKAATDYQLIAIADASESSWDGRPVAPPPFADRPASYTKTVTALIASISAAASYLRANVSPVVQTAYYVNAMTGNDSNNGATPATALRSLAALNSRLSNQNAASPVTVNLQTDFPPSDPLFVDNFNGTLNVIGTRKPIRTGTITGFSPVNRATNSETRITDVAVLDWTPDLALVTGRRVRNTKAGPNLDQIVYVADNVGAGVASTDVPYDINLNEGVFAPGDTYVVEEVTRLTIQTISSSGQISNFPFGTANFNDVHVEGILVETNLGSCFVAYTACHFDALPVVSGDLDIQIVKCSGSQGIISLGGNARVYSGLWGPNTTDRGCIISAGPSGLTTVDYDATAWGGSIKLECGSMAVGLGAAFNCPLFNGSGAGVQIAAGNVQVENLPSGSFALYPFNNATCALYGKGNAEQGIAIGSGSLMSWRDTLPAITGALGDFKLSAGGRERAFNEAAGVYSAVIAPTWAKMATTVAGGGFGGNAHDMSGESHLVKAA